MTVDKLSIISFNSSRKGLQTLSPTQRPSYLQRIIENCSPGICFLPGDDKSAKLHAIQGYGQFTIPNAEDTVLLYDTNKVSMKQTKVNLNSFGPIPGVDLGCMVVPDVEVSSLEPVRSVIRTFNMVSWKYDLFESACAKVSAEKFAEGIVTFSQRLAMSSGKPVLVGGEININFDVLTKIVKKLCTDSQMDYLQTIQPQMAEMGFLPSMTKSSLKSQRHLFMMKVFRCDSQRKPDIVQTWNNRTDVVADCFIASKQLELDEATLLDVEKVTGREIKMPMLAKHKPTQTNMEIPVRPPRHHGG